MTKLGVAFKFFLRKRLKSVKHSAFCVAVLGKRLCHKRHRHHSRVCEIESTPVSTGRRVVCSSRAVDEHSIFFSPLVLFSAVFAILYNVYYTLLPPPPLSFYSFHSLLLFFNAVCWYSLPAFVLFFDQFSRLLCKTSLGLLSSIFSRVGPFMAFGGSGSSPSINSHPCSVIYDHCCHTVACLQTSDLYSST